MQSGHGTDLSTEIVDLNYKQPDLKIHIWMNFPSHHQREFFESLIKMGIALKVTYYEHVSSDRIALGWESESNSASWEASLDQLNISSHQRLTQLADHIHILPGYGSQVIRRLAYDASRLNIKWCHWSEASRNGIRWWARYLIKRNYANLVNQHALGAFAQGGMARLDFIRWGIQTEKIAYLTYAPALPDTTVSVDSRITIFAKGRPVFLYLGQLIHRKAIDVQLKAFAKLKNHNWCLVLAGAGNPYNYQALSKKLGLSDDVLFLPTVAWHQTGSLHQAADVLLLPSRFDGWGAVANEAAALSKALIVSTSCGASWHLVEPGVNGFLVEPGSIESLKSAMAYYVDGGFELSKLHGIESKRISESYTCDASAKRLIQALQSWLPHDI